MIKTLSETQEIIQDNLDYYFDFIQLRTELNFFEWNISINI
jgi:hypothetical protein